MLFTLSGDIISFVLKYLTVDELCALDSSVSHPADRSTLLESLLMDNGPEYYVDGYYYNKQSFISWLNSRCIRLSNLCIQETSLTRDDSTETTVTNNANSLILGASEQSIESVRHLEHCCHPITARETSISDDAYAKINNICKKITSLKLTGNTCLQLILKTLPALSRLLYIRLIHLDMSGDAISDLLRTACSLQHMELAMIIAWKNSVLENMPPSLRTLIIDDRFASSRRGGGLSDDHLAAIVQRVPQLLSLSLLSCAYISHSAIASVLRNCHSLSSLLIDSAPALTADADVFTGCESHLKRLHVKGTISPRALRSILSDTGLAHVRELVLNASDSMRPCLISTADFSSVPPSLTSLDVSLNHHLLTSAVINTTTQTFSLTNLSVNCFPAHLLIHYFKRSPELRSVRWSCGHSEVDKSVCDALARHCRRVEIVDIIDIIGPICSEAALFLAGELPNVTSMSFEYAEEDSSDLREAFCDLQESLLPRSVRIRYKGEARPMYRTIIERLKQSSSWSDS